MIDEKRLIEAITKDRTAFRSGLYTNDSIRKYFIGIVEEQPKVDKWIPCSEGLPEDRKEKLVYLSSDRITVAVYNEHRLPRSGYSIGWGYRVPDSYIDFEKETVIAWQPLPEPYKPQSKK